MKFRVRVRRVEEKFQSYNYRKTPEGIDFDRKSLGWWVLLEGSYESICWGTEKPDLQVGDFVTCTIEKEIVHKVDV